MEALGWKQADVILVSGDAYVDHPSFAAAILGRALEAQGFRVAILSQPDWRSVEPWRELGPPRLFYGVSAGNMDSMINHYTANRKRRNSDAYSPGGRINLRPDRATAVYCQRCREAFKGVPVIAGGVEASLRRIAHYDYWSDRVMPSILLSSKAHLLVFGMGEQLIVDIAQRLQRGAELGDLRELRGVAYLLGAKEPLPEHTWPENENDGSTVALPSLAEVERDPRTFAQMTRLVHRESNPLNGRRLIQAHGERLVVVNPAQLPLAGSTLDGLYELPFTRRPHPRYSEPVPAFETIRHSVQIMRGCFGGCSFCSITLHQGRSIQSRSAESVLREVQLISRDPSFRGHLSDLGGPTANMYRMGCSDLDAESRCRRLSCLHPRPCKLLNSDHRPLVELLRLSRAVPGVRRIHVASGLRMDLAVDAPEYVEELAAHHVGGHLKVAPEHVNETVLHCMRKASRQGLEEFARRFAEASRHAGLEQYLVPYFMASHPGCGIEEMIELAVFLKRTGYRPQQVQDFIPAPMDLATCMYHTGLDPHSMRPVFVARGDKARRQQRALLQYFKPENWHTVHELLRQTGHHDLIGSHAGALIPAKPPPGAWRGSRRVRPTAENRGGRPRGYRHAARTRGRERGGD